MMLDSASTERKSRVLFARTLCTVYDRERPDEGEMQVTGESIRYWVGTHHFHGNRGCLYPKLQYTAYTAVSGQMAALRLAASKSCCA